MEIVTEKHGGGGLAYILIMIQACPQVQSIRQDALLINVINENPSKVEASEILSTVDPSLKDVVSFHALCVPL